MKKKVIFLLITFFTLAGYSQDKLSKEQKKQFKQAQEAFEIGDFQSAMNYFKAVYPADSMEPYLNYKIGVSMFNLKKYRKDAYPYFKRAETGKYKDCFYYLGVIEHLRMNFDEALNNLKKWKRATGMSNYTLKDVDRQIQITETAMKMVKSPINVQIENLGESINSRFPDYVPLISADGNMMVFTSRREGSSENKLDPNGDYFEDIYISHKVNGSWEKPKSISPTINTPSHDACVALSSDGSQLLTYRTSEDQLSGDIYSSLHIGESWTPPVKLPEVINSDDYLEASATLGTENEVIYFSSDRPGGFGMKDIYRSRKLPDGSWSLPQNLGPIVNSEADEDAPFIHPDGKTLYFSSRGHKTMGGYDIFKTHLEDSVRWAVPENLGYPINSVEDDVYFVLSADGKQGYFSANRPNGFGDHDIYLIKDPEQFFKLNMIKGRIKDQSSGTAVHAKITLLNKTSGSVEGVFRTNKMTGKFVLIGYPGQNYDIIIESPDHNAYIQPVTFPAEDLQINLSRKEGSK